MTRLSLVINMKDAETLRIRVEDLGFGEIYPGSGQVWEQDISLGQEE